MSNIGASGAEEPNTRARNVLSYVQSTFRLKAVLLCPFYTLPFLYFAVSILIDKQTDRYAHGRTERQKDI